MLAAGAAFLLAVSACTLPRQTANNNLESPSPSPSPSHSPSPTPTAAFAVAGPGFHAGEVGVAYGAVALTASGGVKPYKWSVASGALPAGLTLGPDGTISGTPAGAGSFTFTIQASDSGDSKTSIPGTISVAARLTASLLPACATYCKVEIGCSNACGAFGSFSGGVAPYSLTVKQGPLPVGTALSPSSLTLNGTFGGQPGYLQFAVQVGDALGATTTISPTFWMYKHISLSGGTCRGIYTCTVQLKYSGGVPGPLPTAASAGWTGGSCAVVAVIPCPPPDTFSATVQAGVVTITLTYPQNIYYNGTLTVRLTESNLCGAGVHCSTTATVNVIA